MLLEKLRTLSFLSLLAAVACSGGAGTIGGETPAGALGGPVGGGADGGPGPGSPGSNTTVAAAPLQGGFSDPSADINFRYYNFLSLTVTPQCREPSNQKVLYHLKGSVEGVDGAVPMDGRVLRVLLLDNNEFFDESLVGKTQEVEGRQTYFGEFEFSMLIEQLYLGSFHVLAEGSPNSGESPHACSENLCPPADARSVAVSPELLAPPPGELPSCQAEASTISVPVLHTIETPPDLRRFQSQ